MSILPVIQDFNLYYLKLEARVLTYLCLVTIIGLISNGFSNPKGATRFILKIYSKPCPCGHLY